MDLSPELRNKFDDEVSAAIDANCHNGSREDDHRDADEALILLLTKLGFTKTVEAWKKVGKWYA